MNNNKYISILIPLYNGLEYLEESTNSIINQTYKNWELLIGINGMYNDNNFINKVNNIVNKLKNNNINKNLNIKIFNFNFKGKSKCLNAMIKYAKYDYIALLDVDDIWLSNKLELQIKYLDNYDIIGTKCQYFGDMNIIPNIPTGDISNFNFFSFNPIINSSIIIRKNDAIWCEDEDLILEDYDMWLRLNYENKKFYNINEILCYHRIHKNSYFNNINNNNNNINILKKKWLNID
jgi:glycosyltransferase involved in cell wall biosynthesis